jgi:hypothetical protein
MLLSGTSVNWMSRNLEIHCECEFQALFVVMQQFLNVNLFVKPSLQSLLRYGANFIESIAQLTVGQVRYADHHL